MKEYRSTPITIDTQGAPMLAQECAYIIKEGDDVVALQIDMQSKYCEPSVTISISNGDIGIGIDANEDSLYLDETKNKEESTIIYFPEFKGWDIFSSDSSRYSINICLIKEEKSINKNLTTEEKLKNVFNCIKKQEFDIHVGICTSFFSEDPIYNNMYEFLKREYVEKYYRFITMSDVSIVVDNKSNTLIVKNRYGKKGFVTGE